MFSQKLVSLLQTFSKPELNRFRKFLLSPYFNDQEDLTQLFEIMNRTLREGENALPQLDKTIVWKSLYPKKKFDDAHLRRLSSDLNQLALRFLVEEARKQDSLAEALELQAVLDKPELKKHLAGLERQIQKFINETAGQSAWFYFSKFRMYLNISNRTSKIVATSNYIENLLSASHFLDCFYFIQKLKLYIAWLIYRDVRSTHQDMALLPNFMDYLKETRFNNVPLVAIYQNVIVCLLEPDDENHFNVLMNNLEKFADNLTREDLIECYRIAQNYCAFKINQGKTDYYKEVFKIFQQTIQKNILLEGEQLSEAVFKNIITASLGIGEYDWAEAFIQNYSDYLPKDIRYNAYTFNLSYLYFHQKKYEKVIELLRNVEYSDIVYALSAKLILVRTYYELNEFIALDSLIDSFRIFIRRNKIISKSQKREYNNFLNFVKRLTTISPSDGKSFEKLKRRATETSSAMPKKWLLEKIEEKENNSKR